MKQKVIVDLAVLADDQNHCPICRQELVQDFALYSYLSFKGVRTRLTPVLKCRNCNQIFGTFDTIDRMYKDPCPDDKLLRVSQLKYHVVRDDQIDSNARSVNCSVLETVK